MPASEPVFSSSATSTKSFPAGGSTYCQERWLSVLGDPFAAKQLWNFDRSLLSAAIGRSVGPASESSAEEVGISNGKIARSHFQRGDLNVDVIYAGDRGTSFDALFVRALAAEPTVRRVRLHLRSGGGLTLPSSRPFDSLQFALARAGREYVDLRDLTGDPKVTIAGRETLASDDSKDA